jgi:hypothetical protein
VGDDDEPDHTKGKCPLRHKLSYPAECNWCDKVVGIPESNMELHKQKCKKWREGEGKAEAEGKGQGEGEDCAGDDIGGPACTKKDDAGQFAQQWANERASRPRAPRTHTTRKEATELMLSAARRLVPHGQEGPLDELSKHLALQAYPLALDVTKTSIATTLLPGPPGCGKTSGATSMASSLVGWPHLQVINVDGETFKTESSTTRFLGADPGNVCSDRPDTTIMYQIERALAAADADLAAGGLGLVFLILNELEKMDPSASTVLLTPLSEARMTSSLAQTIQLPSDRFFVIFTTNAGEDAALQHHRAAALGQSCDIDVEEQVVSTLGKKFGNALVRRTTGKVIVFPALAWEAGVRSLRDSADSLEKIYGIHVSDEVVRAHADCVDPRFGIGMIKDKMQRRLEQLLIMSGGETPFGGTFDTIETHTMVYKQDDETSFSLALDVSTLYRGGKWRDTDGDSSSNLGADDEDEEDRVEDNKNDEVDDGVAMEITEAVSCDPEVKKSWPGLKKETLCNFLPAIPDAKTYNADRDVWNRYGTVSILSLGGKIEEKTDQPPPYTDVVSLDEKGVVLYGGNEICAHTAFAFARIVGQKFREQDKKIEELTQAMTILRVENQSLKEKVDGAVTRDTIAEMIAAAEERARTGVHGDQAMPATIPRKRKNSRGGQPEKKRIRREQGTSRPRPHSDMLHGLASQQGSATNRSGITYPRQCPTMGCTATFSDRRRLSEHCKECSEGTT